MTNYTQNQIVIAMNTDTPEATHELLLSALNAAVRLSMQCPTKRTEDMAQVSVLMDLQQALMLNERQFLKISG